MIVDISDTLEKYKKDKLEEYKEAHFAEARREINSIISCLKTSPVVIEELIVAEEFGEAIELINRVGKLPETLEEALDQYVRVINTNIEETS